LEGQYQFNSVIDDKNKVNKIFSENHTYKSIKFEFKEEFYEYLVLQGYARNNALAIKAYFRKHLLGKSFNEPLDLEKYLHNKSGVRHIIKTARIYLNFCEKHEKLALNIIGQYRKFLKVPKTRTDYKVPSDEEVKTNFELIKENDILEIVYSVLMCSGIRLVECLDFLKNYDSNNFVKHEGFVSYNVNNDRKTKKINVIYLPVEIYNKLKHVDLTYHQLLKIYNKHNCSFSLKYLRKWNYNFLLYNKVPESVADFIQGRVSKSVSANHYLAKAQQAEFWYEKINDIILKQEK